MIIGPNYVFIAVPRTASMSIAAWLVAEHGGVWHGDHHDTDIPPEHQGKHVFAVVRNPLTRLPSLHRYVRDVFWANEIWRSSAEAATWRALGMPFDSELETFVDWAATQRGHQWCSQDEMLSKAPPDEVFRFEDLPGCLRHLPFVSGSVQLPKLGETGRAPALTATEIRSIVNHSAADFERFGYAKP